MLARRAASSLAIGAMLIALLGFFTLASTSQTTEATLVGEVRAAIRGPYHLLVRPAASRSELEAQEGLVRPNYLSGVSGGITRQQYEAVRGLLGVEVAAPLALTGFLQWPSSWVVDLGGYLQASEDLAVLRMSFRAFGEGGLSTFPLEDHYLIVAPTATLEATQGRGEQLRLAGATVDCTTVVLCFAQSRMSPQVLGGPEQRALARLEFPEPIVVAGIDPKAEAALAGLDSCVRSGRYLQPSDGLAERSVAGAPQTMIPVLLSQRAFLDETVEVTIERARDPAPVRSGAAPSQVGNWEPIATQSRSADDIYREFLAALGSGSFYNFSPLWSPQDVAYTRTGPGQLRAKAVAPDYSVFDNVRVPGGANLAPPEARDVWLRQLLAHPQVRSTEVPNGWLPVGRYDPTCLPGFDPLAGGTGLDAYALPRVSLPGGGDLGPTRSMAGYVNSPPLVLTTLDGAAWLSDRGRFRNAPGEAFISIIRVRVAGLDDLSAPQAQAKLASVAAQVHELTGLAVDIVAGSSPRPLEIELPAGTFGRPQLVVGEGWQVPGVAYRFTQALQAQDLALFGVALVAALGLVTQTGYVSVRRRQPELAVLKACGWAPRHLAALVLIEILGLGIAAGGLAVALAVPLGILLGTSASLGHLLVIFPLALLIAALAAVGPAAAASRASVTRTFAGAAAVRRSRIPSAPWQVAMLDLLPRRGDLLVPAAVVGLGGGILGAIVLLQQAFRGQLDVTVLGVYLSGRVQPYHLTIALLALALGALGAAQIVSLSLLDRRLALAALRALGWAPRDILAFIATQGLVIGLLGGLIGAILCAVLAFVLRAPPLALAIAVAATVLVSVLASGIAMIAALVQSYRLSPGRLLRDE